MLRGSTKIKTSKAGFEQIAALNYDLVYGRVSRSRVLPVCRKRKQELSLFATQLRVLLNKQLAEVIKYEDCRKT